MRLLLLFSLIFLFPTCLSAQGPEYRDIAASSGVNSLGRSHGVSFADFNNDGFEDIYISKVGSVNLLYRNNGDLTFTETAAAAGVAFQPETHCAVWGDIDNDGYIDLYLGNSVSNTLYKNNGNGTFTDITGQAGVGHESKPNAVNMADVDGDGFLDIYLSHPREENVLYINTGDGTFTEQTEASGALDSGFSMGSLFFDYDNDLDLDLYLVHDGKEPNILYQNNGKGKFTDVTESAGVGFEGLGMGVDFGDLNNDGYFDLYITNLYENTLYRNNGNGSFTEISEIARVDDYGMGWGTTWLDFDNDGLQDIYVSNESNFSPYPNVLYRNLGNETFEIVSEGTPLHSMLSGFGLACADVNNDGGVDIFVANESTSHADELFLFSGIPQHWVAIKAQGVNSNHSGIGVRAEVEVEGSVQADIVTAGASYASQNSLILHFGLGQSTVINRLSIYWPSGLTDHYFEVPVDQVYTAIESQGLQSNGNEELVTALVKNSTPTKEYLINYPNPFDSFTQIEFSLKKHGQVKLSLYDLTGDQVATLLSQELKAGVHRIEWSPTPGLPKGMYFLQVKQGHSTKVHKILKF